MSETKGFNELREEGFIDFVTFHPSFSYEDFVEGYRPTIGGGFDLEDGVFKRMCCYALDRLIAEKEGREWKKPENTKSVIEKWEELPPEDKKAVLSEENINNVLEKSDGKFILLIDEINRANISKVLGELITLLEPDKRLGSKKGLTVSLPYSKKEFGIPPNLFIIGTMNTADKSIALVDIALRRRFGFEEFMPISGDEFYSLVEEVSKTDGETITKEEIQSGLLDLGRLLDVMNRRIVFLADREKQIGHSYFLNVLKKDGKYVNNKDVWQGNLNSMWYKEIIPLLQEYFYNDYGKIRMIIGPEFIAKEPVPKFLKKSGEFDLEDIERYEIRQVPSDQFIDKLKEVYESTSAEADENTVETGVAGEQE